MLRTVCGGAGDAAADLTQCRRITPDLATWTQCFTLYAAVLGTQQPERVPDLMAYQALVARTSLKYTVVVKKNFRFY